MRRWLMLVLLIGGTLICGMLMWALLSPTKQPDSSIVLKPSDEDTDQGVSRLPIEVAIDRTRRILAASDPEQLRSLIRPGSMSSEEILLGLEELEAEHGASNEPVWLGALDSLAHPIETLVVNYEDGHRRLMDYVVDDAGEWKADMDSYFQVCEAPFADLLSGLVDQALIRALGKPDTYYNGPFSDESEWACYSLRKDSKSEALYGYCRLDSKVMEHLRRIQSKTDAALDSAGTGGSPRKDNGHRLTLTIKRRANSGKNQFEIAAVLSDTWSIPDQPFADTLDSRE